MTVDRDQPCVIRAEGIAKRYGTADAVRDLNLTVRKGEIYGFLGPNGAGKTTTILMLLGIEQPTAGRIEVFGQPGPLDPFQIKRRIGVLSEVQYLYDDMSAWEYLMFFARLYRVARAEARAQALLERLDLWAFRRLRARDHSRGMQQKLGLTRALLHGPELLVLDEPVSGLDPHGIKQVREVLTEQNRLGVTIFISSHILSEVERTAHRVGILHGGRLVVEDEVDMLSARLRPESVIELTVEQLGPTLVETLRRQPYVIDVVGLEVGGAPSAAARLRVTLRGGSDHRRALSAVVGSQGGLITQMTEKRLSLEEAFVQLTTENVGSLVPTEDALART